MGTAEERRAAAQGAAVPRRGTSDYTLLPLPTYEEDSA